MKSDNVVCFPYLWTSFYYCKSYCHYLYLVTCDSLRFVSSEIVWLSWALILTAYILLFQYGCFVLHMHFPGQNIFFPSLHLVFSSWLWITIPLHTCVITRHTAQWGGDKFSEVPWILLLCCFLDLPFIWQASFSQVLWQRLPMGSSHPALDLTWNRHSAVIWRCDLCCDRDSPDTFAFLFDRSLRSTRSVTCGKKAEGLIHVLLLLLSLFLWPRVLSRQAHQGLKDRSRSR